MSGRAPSLRIAILTSGRFHVLDLARELVALGHDVTFYSLLPPWQLTARGLDARRGVWVGALALAPQLAHGRLGAPALAMRAAQLASVTLDHTAVLRLRPCDVLIAMAGMALRTITRAHALGALCFLERASQHIEAQLEILGVRGERRKIEREIAEYAAADRIAVPSRHVEASFLERGLAASKIVRNPLGVDLSEFPWSRGPTEGPLRVLAVGAWTYQKGADVLARAADAVPEARFAHVGAAPEPGLRPGARFSAHAPVPQPALAAFYDRADVLVLASRQDGFGMVMSQALASGCHVVASDRTGGPDLRELLGADAPIDVVPAADEHALARTLRTLHERRDELRARRRALAPWRERLSWRGYAERYEHAMLGALASDRPGWHPGGRAWTAAP